MVILPGFVFESKGFLQKAMNEWCADPVAAKIEYGDVVKWDVLRITDMSGLLLGKETW